VVDGLSTCECQEESGGGGSHLRQRLVDRGQRRIRPLGDGQVVETDDYLASGSPSTATLTCDSP
jgi:hypothetical protein